MRNRLFGEGMFRNQQPQYIKGISCNVKNCAYHDGESYCTADKINVGPSYANSCTDTVCATFRPKGG